MIKYLILFVSLFLNFSYCQTNFELGRNEYLNGNFEKSIELLTKSIEADQELAKAYMYRGISKAFMGRFRDAISDLNVSKLLDPKDYKLYYYYGKTYLFSKDYDLSLISYDTSLEMNPKFALSYDERAGVKIELNDLQGALLDEDMAISLDSFDEEFYTNRAYIKSLMKKYEDAIIDFNSSIKLRPTIKAYSNRGIIYSKLNLNMKAIEDYTKALNMNSNLPDVLFLRGLSYKILGQKSEACNDFKKSCDLGYFQAVEEKNKNCN